MNNAVVQDVNVNVNKNCGFDEADVSDVTQREKGKKLYMEYV